MERWSLRVRTGIRKEKIKKSAQNRRKYGTIEVEKE